MKNSFDNYAKEGLHEECGVFGIFSDGTINPAYACYNGLLALQHRGQESCGIAVTDDGVIDYHKDMGLVTEVFNNRILDSLQGQMGIAHVRYSTAGGSVLENSQPLVMRYVKGTLAVAHNGNLTNALEIRSQLEQTGAIFQTTIDSEAICYVIARERLKCHSVEEAVARTMRVIKGAYSLLVMSPRKLIAARDPHGFRPLCMGKYNDSVVLQVRAQLLTHAEQNLSEILNPVKLWLLTIKKSAVLNRISEKKRSSHFVFLNIFILPARTPLLTVSASMRQENRQAEFWQGSFR